jgi:Putative peptidoglycan binding domain
LDSWFPDSIILLSSLRNFLLHLSAATADTAATGVIPGFLISFLLFWVPRLISLQEQSVFGLRYDYVRMRFVLVAAAVGIAIAGSVWASDDVRAVQEKLRDGGFYSGEIDGAYSSELAAALTRYQIRNGLPISGQLDVETSKALGAKPAVGPSTAAAEQSSDTWRRLRKGERRMSTSARRSETAATRARETSSPGTDEAGGNSTETENVPGKKTTTTVSGAQVRDSSSPQEAAARNAPVSSETTAAALAPPATGRTSSESTEPASAPPATAVDTGHRAPEFSAERVRDYVAAFVLAGLDKNVGAETEFFADRVEYYDSGVMDREKIREDLKRYDERWPERHFWVAGPISIEPQSDKRVRVTFPLGFKLRNGNRTVTAKVDKTLVLEPAGEDLQIVAVSERKK